MRLRLILSFAFIVLVTVVGVVLIARQGAVSEVRAFMYRGGMVGESGLISALQEYYRAYGSWGGVESLFEASSPGHGMGRGGMGGMGAMMGQRLRIADAGGIVVADSDGLQVGENFNSEEMASSLPVEIDGNTVGYLLVGSGRNFTAEDSSFLESRLNRAALLAGLIAGSLALVLALILAYRLLRPLGELNRAASRLGRGDLSQRVPVSGDDEIAVLGRTFNSMASSLQQAEARRRELTADIAHELRNPLAVQRANLEALQDGVYPLTSENLSPILEQNRLLTRLVDDLHTLALADSGQLNLDLQPTDMSALISSVLERFKPQAAHQKVEIRFKNGDLVKMPPLLVDGMRIEQVLINLLSNALRFSPEHSTIELYLSHKDEALNLTVKDAGPGISDEAMPYIFNRFYRADRSRSRTVGGSGLGLAIARQLVVVHGGELSAANHPEGGAVFTITLPIKGAEVTS